MRAPRSPWRRATPRGARARAGSPSAAACRAARSARRGRRARRGCCACDPSPGRCARRAGRRRAPAARSSPSGAWAWACRSPAGARSRTAARCARGRRAGCRTATAARCGGGSRRPAARRPRRGSTSRRRARRPRCARSRRLAASSSSTAGKLRIAPAREVGADVRDAGGAERLQRVRDGAARHLVGLRAPRAARSAGRQRSIRSHTRCAPSRREMPTCPRTHIRSSMRATLRRVRPAGRLPRDRRAVLDVARAQRALLGEPLEDVRAKRRLAVPPRVQPGPPRAAARRAHRVAVDRQVLAEHVGRLVRPVLEQRALAVGELLEARLVEGAVAARTARAGASARRPRSGRVAGSAGRARCRAGPARSACPRGSRPREPLVADREPADRRRAGLGAPRAG